LDITIEVPFWFYPGSVSLDFLGACPMVVERTTTP